ncbi:DUF397 domain-containing protein [Streptomyces sp. NPDC056716]|uniref:DUF397 domain-containing protein n=1 Tax=unclassified Streptomyces TaxID=2593676 RepID=UPI0036B18AD2
MRQAPGETLNQKGTGMTDLYDLPLPESAAFKKAPLRFTTAELDAAGIDPARFGLSA